MPESRVRVCIVCLGNICRSPTGEGVFREHVSRAGLAHRIEVESRGTGDWHVGEPPDPRTVAAARKYGIALTSLARLFTPRDFEHFDYVLPVDRANLTKLERLAQSETARKKLRLFRSFEHGAPPNAEVPDPYYGDEDGFDDVFRICERASQGLLAHLRAEHAL